MGCGNGKNVWEPAGSPGEAVHQVRAESLDRRVSFRSLPVTGWISVFRWFPDVFRSPFPVSGLMEKRMADMNKKV
jgi:hypothetical protein